MGNDPSKQKQDQNASKSNFVNNNASSVGNNTTTSSPKDDPYKIVTVTTFQKPTDLEETENVLEQFPRFTPLIPTSADPKWSWKMLKSPPVAIDPKAILTVCSQTQEFFHDSGAEIAQNQQLLGLKVSRSQDKIVEAHNSMFQHAQDVKSFDLYLREINRVNQMVENINQNLRSVLETVERLYDLLPPEEKDLLENPKSLLEQKPTDLQTPELSATLKFDPNQALQQFLKSAASIESILHGNKEKNKEQTYTAEKSNPT